MSNPSTEDARIRFLRSELDRIVTLILLATEHRGRRQTTEAVEALDRARQAIANARVFVRMLKPNETVEAELTVQLADLQSAIDSFQDPS